VHDGAGSGADHDILSKSMRAFGYTTFLRTASGDAFMTAQVFLRLLRLAARHGRSTLGKLMEPFQPPA
jgi:hypothetical protein